MKKIFAFLLLFVGLLVSLSYADDAVLEWDDNSDADYYVVYWSTDPGSFDTENSMEIPADFNFVELEDSPNGQTYYFSVKAFNSCGNSSDFSETVYSKHIPSDVSYGDIIDSEDILNGDSTKSVDVTGAQEEATGCFIGSMGF